MVVFALLCRNKSKIWCWNDILGTYGFVNCQATRALCSTGTTGCQAVHFAEARRSRDEKDLRASEPFVEAELTFPTRMPITHLH